jgi:hypothetical protein
MVANPEVVNPKVPFSSTAPLKRDAGVFLASCKIAIPLKERTRKVFDRALSPRLS